MRLGIPARIGLVVFVAATLLPEALVALFYVGSAGLQAHRQSHRLGPDEGVLCGG